MNELERRIEKLKHQLKDTQDELDTANELHTSFLWRIEQLNVDLVIANDLDKSRKWNNGLLICLVISMALWIATA